MKPILFFASIFFSLTLFGQIESEFGEISTNFQGAPVLIGLSNSNFEVDLFPSANEVDKKIINQYTLAVDKNHKEFFSNEMDVKVKLEVERWDENSNQLSDTSIYLSVNYNPFTDTTYVSEQRVSSNNGAYKIKVVLDSIYIDGVSNDTLPANLFIRGEIVAERYTDFTTANTAISFTTISELDDDCDGKIEAIKIMWDAPPQVQEYQLEWLHINDYSNILTTDKDPAILNYDFKYNSTRISTSDDSYNISMIYDKGWVVFRLRGIGVNAANPQQNIFGIWNGNRMGTVASTAALNKYQVDNTIQHEKLLNWQYSATYAEEGKRKEVISYFDGSLRNRQTVTKINSDENIIVGETIYDSQGRPTISVLPSPVVTPVCEDGDSLASLKFYPNFNQNENGDGYSRTDFDLDDPNAVCATSASPMGNESGSSNYYSDHNLNIENEQGYVPDAQLYPFAQVEYTPDNTGRIRRQGGVGPEYQIGNGNETEYLYGQPNQLELDRLFGSEVGFSSHYKKNVVIDAHGQASISYLDQEGRVIATALAGENPSNLLGITSESDSHEQLSVNVFDSENANNLTINGDGYAYSTQLLVAYESDYTFSYNFVIPPIQDPCLPDICIDCVYDLKIELVDECGVNLLPSNLQETLVGNFIFDSQSGEYTFHSVCSGSPNGEVDEDFTVQNLVPGAYSLNKVLTINSEARQAYVNQYIENSTCVTTLEDFENQYLAEVDSTDCFVDCESCFEDLGSLDDFIANGNGSANDYYLLQENCERVCNPEDFNYCDAALSLLRMDMAPDGQYGEYPVLSSQLSIYGTNSLLPISNSNWNNPKFTDASGIDHFYFQDDNGDSSRIVLNELAGGVFEPSQSGGAQIKYDPTNDYYYIYPNELANVSDFVNLFDFSWTQSLVYMHPEYCYYESCIVHEVKVNSGDDYTSESFDQLLLNTTTFQDAVSSGFIKDGFNEIFTNGTVPAGDLQDPLNDWFDNSAGNPWDPFVVFGEEFAFDDCASYKLLLSDKFNNYQEVDGVMRSMPEMAAFAARCGTNFYGLVNVDCFKFGNPINGVYDIAILNNEWQQLKSFYLSAKQLIKQDLADCIALNTCDAYSACIGDEDFNPFTTDLMDVSNGVLGFYNSPYFDANQICGNTLRALYVDKVRRFGTAEQLNPIQDANQAAYEVYLQTGQCPTVFALQDLIKALGINQELDNSNVILNNYGQLTSLFLAQNNYANPGTIPTLTTSVSISGNQLTQNWIDNATSSTFATLKLTLPVSFTGSWDDLENFVNLTPTGASNFTITAVYVDGQGAFQTIELTGQLTNFTLDNCTFENDCTLSNLGLDIQNLFNGLVQGQAFTNTSFIDIDPLVTAAGNINSLETPLLLNAVGNYASNLKWKQNNSNEFILASNFQNLNDGLYITFNSAIPSSFMWSGFSNVVYFYDMLSDGTHGFTVKAQLINGDIVQLTGDLVQILNDEPYGIAIGDCDLPTPAACQTSEHDAFDALLLILEEHIATGFTTNLDLYASIHMDNAISNQFAPTVNSTSSTYDAVNEVLTISAGGCITTITADSPASLSDLVSITNAYTTGPMNNSMNYNDFTLEGMFNGTGFGTIQVSTCLNIQICQNCPPIAMTVEEMDTIRQERMSSGDYEQYSSLSSSQSSSFSGGQFAYNPEENDSILEAENPCIEAFDQYNDCIHDFNSWANMNNFEYLIEEVARYQTFERLGLCFCVDEFCARLNEIKDGLIEFSEEGEFYLYIDIEQICNVPCTPEINNGALFLDTTVVEIQDDCMEMQVNIAYSNALLEYENYINNLTGQLIEQYNSHCLSVEEEFQYSYDDKLYHFTLYYYDQAGNLIKTIPPEGVERLATTASDDAISLQIKSDRVNGTKTVYTNHRLATRYQYNSLNQLVAQSSPDTDPMNVFELTLPSGLHGRLETQKIQMINDNTGYLAGSVDDRGYLYRTDDGGITWNRVYGLVASDLNKAVMIDNNIGFAVGSHGTVLKTIDGGSNWDMIDFWGQTGKLDNLNDIILYTDNTSSQRIIVVGDNGLVASSSDFNTFSLSNTGISSNFNLVSIALDQNTNTLFIAANGPTHALTYTTGLTGNNWSEFNLFDATTLNAIDIDEAGNIVAGGDDGRIYINSDLSDVNSRWILKETDINGSISDIKYQNNDQTIAIIDDNLMRSTDGGSSWDNLSSDTHKHLSKSANGKVVLAIRDVEKPQIWVRAAAINVPVQPIDLNTLYPGVTTQDFTAGWIETLNSDYAVVLTQQNNTIQFTENALSANPLWKNIDATPHLLAGESIIDLQVKMTSTEFRIIFKTSIEDRIYLCRISRSAGTFTQNPVYLKKFVRSFKYDNVSDFVYALISNSEVYRFNITSGLNNLMGTMSDGNDIIIQNNAIGVVGDNIYRATKSGSTLHNASIIDKTNATNPTNLKDIIYSVADAALLLVGDNGNLYSKSINWEQVETNTKKNFNAITDDDNDIYIVGESGYFTKGHILANTYISQPQLLTNGLPVENGVTQDLNDILFKGTIVYVVGDNGKMLYSPNPTMNFASINHGSTDLKAVIPTASSFQFLSFGSNTTIKLVSGTNFMAQKNIFTPGLLDVHFKSPGVGSVIADNYTVRTTSNAGLNWNAITSNLPVNVGYKKVFTKDASKTLILGTSVPQESTNLIATDLASGPTNVVDLSQRNNEILVVSATSVEAFNTDTYVSTTITSGLSNVNAIQEVNNGDFMVTGENGFFSYYNSNGIAIFTSLPADLNNKNFNDIMFVDNTHFALVGDNGAYYKAKNPSFDSNGNLIGTGWSEVLGLYSTGADPLGVDAAIEVDIYSIAFSTATNGVFGGKYNASFANQNPISPYVRTVFDPNNRYSSRFFYDRLGRLVVSQNARQYNGVDRKFSYTIYDELGRVVEVGEKTENPTMTETFKSAFGTDVSDYYNPSVIDDSKLSAWINGNGARKEVTKSYYDESIASILPAGFSPDILNQRKRITHVTYEAVFDDNDLTYDHATHYDYDIHGNVQTLYQDNKKMADDFASIADQRYKRMDYTYDLVSGNVHRMSVQHGEKDQWHHAYRYDSDNRIIAAYTNDQTPFLASSSLPQALENELQINPDWKQEARYFYYDHGPLARTELGEDQLQGTDYIYNIQGWLKGVNGIEMDGVTDPGKDGVNSSVNENFANDVMAFSLHYFDNDYLAINGLGQNHSPTVASASHAAQNSSDLYNGNIRFMQTTLTNPDSRTIMPMLNAYQYDQLNRLVEARSYETGLSGGQWNPSSYDNEYFNKFDYDAMGNILHQDRHLRDGTQIEDMSYQYNYDGNNNLLQNRLYHINDNIADNIDGVDIDDMGTFTPGTNINLNNNYSYDEEGRLKSDVQEEISNIIWRVDGKVKEIQRPISSDKKIVSFDYDAMGNRIAKHITNNQTAMLEKSTYYILDAQGNTLNTYDHEVQSASVTYTLKDRQIYGSSRLGIYDDSVSMYASASSPYVNLENGHKYYELSNHLGNVLTVIKDVKYPTSTNGTTVDNYEVAIVNITDYSPFGVQLDGRTYNKSFVVAGPPAPAELVEEAVVYTNLVGTQVNGGNNLELSSSATNGWTNGANGAQTIEDGEYLIFEVGPGNITGHNSMVGISYQDGGPGYASIYYTWNFYSSGVARIWKNGTMLQSFGARQVGDEYSIHRENGNIVFKINGVVVRTEVDDFPNLSMIPDMSIYKLYNNNYYEVYNLRIGKWKSPDPDNYAGNDYRYGFQGQEKDDEVKGEGNSVNYKYRMHDPRVGRFFAVDPLSPQYPHYTPYSFSGNKVIHMVEFEGLEEASPVLTNSDLWKNSCGLDIKEQSFSMFKSYFNYSKLTSTSDNNHDERNLIAVTVALEQAKQENQFVMANTNFFEKRTFSRTINKKFRLSGIVEIDGVTYLNYSETNATTIVQYSGDYRAGAISKIINSSVTANYYMELGSVTFNTYEFQSDGLAIVGNEIPLDYFEELTFENTLEDQNSALDYLNGFYEGTTVMSDIDSDTKENKDYLVHMDNFSKYLLKQLNKLTKDSKTESKGVVPNDLDGLFHVLRSISN